jgi:tRNA(Ile)-lysidine synthase
VVVAISGGADSAALALLLGEASRHGLPLSLVLAWLDHGWRGPGAAARDRAVAAAIAGRLGAPLLSAGPPATPCPTEAAARRWRYGRLEAIALERGAEAIATGHHLRDQAETVLMRSARDSGALGRAGILPRRGALGGRLAVVRPLLGVHPEDLRVWLAARGVAWAEDPTNDDLSRERNRARRALLDLGPAEREATRALGDVAAREREALEARTRAVAALLGPVLTRAPWAGAVAVPHAVLGALGPDDLHTALRLLASTLGIEDEGPLTTRRHRQAIAVLLVRGGALDLPRGRRVHVRGGRAWLVAPEQRREVRALLRWATGPRGALIAGAPHGGAALDPGALGDEARMRGVREDDRFRPFGGARGPVSVAGWLKRAGVPAFLRAGHPVLVGRSGVAWVPGHRIDRAHALGPGARSAVWATVEGAGAR